MKQLLLVFLGGGMGSIFRYLLALNFNSPKTGIPYGTLSANIAGSLLIGFILGMALKHQTFSPNTVLFLATGFCGGFTTFSTFAYENHVLLKAGDFATFALYTLLSFVMGFAMVFLGMWLGKSL